MKNEIATKQGFKIDDWEKTKAEMKSLLITGQTAWHDVSVGNEPSRW